MDGESRQPQKQLRLWDQIIPDPMPVLKAAMSDTIKRCSLSREQICDAMTEMARRAGIKSKVTPAILDKWCAQSAAAHMIPLRLLHIFCRAVGSNVPFEAYSACFQGVRVVSEDAYRILQWAVAEIEARKARKLAKRRAVEVGAE